MLVIIEGPDGAGKSSLALKLAEKIGDDGHSTAISHQGPPTLHALDEYLRSVTFYRPGQDVHVIYDRFHWGELVYPYVRNRPTTLDEPAEWLIESYLRRLGAVVVRCSAYTDTYKRVYEDRGESDQLAELAEVEKYFDNAEKYTRLPVLRYNWESTGNSSLHSIIQTAQAAEKIATQFNPFVTYSGPARPELLLLGDVRHKYVKTHPRYESDPAFVPMPATSGHFLLKHFVPHSQFVNVGLANACDVDDVRELLNVLQPRYVVTLGSNAHRKLRELGRPHGAVPHPQYIRRFWHKMGVEYVNAIDYVAQTGEDLRKWPSSLKVQPARMSTPKSSRISDFSAAVRTAETVPS